MTHAETQSAPIAEPKGEKAPKQEPAPKQPEANGVSRPKYGTSTGRIWEIADHESAKLGSPAPRKIVLELATKEGINESTAATQYGRWRKFHGLKSDPKPVVEKAPKEPKAKKEKKVKAEAEGPKVE